MWRLLNTYAKVAWLVVRDTVTATAFTPAGIVRSGCMTLLCNIAKFCMRMHALFAQGLALVVHIQALWVSAISAAVLGHEPCEVVCRRS